MLDSQTAQLSRTLTNELVAMAPESLQFDWMRCKRIFRAFCYVGKTFTLWEPKNGCPSRLGTIKVLNLDFSDQGYVIKIRMTLGSTTRIFGITHELSTLIPGKLLVCIPPVMVLIKRGDKRHPQFQLLFKTEGGSEMREGELCMSDDTTFTDKVLEASL